MSSFYWPSSNWPSVDYLKVLAIKNVCSNISTQKHANQRASGWEEYKTKLYLVPNTQTFMPCKFYKNVTHKWNPQVSGLQTRSVL